jgi:hypothetical protein
MNGIRTKEILGIAMLGEGLVGLIFPRKYSRFWAVGPQSFKNFMNWAADHPGSMRAACAAEAGLGFWLAAEQLKSMHDRSRAMPYDSSMREIDGRLENEPASEAVETQM